MAREIILVNISGNDRPGVTSSMMEILGRHGATILDIGQADIYHNLSLGILFLTDNETASGQIMKQILFKSSELDVNVKFTPITEDNYTTWVESKGKSRFIITVLGKVIKAEQISLVSNALSAQGLNIDSIKRLTGRPSLDYQIDDESVRSCVEFSVRGNINDKQNLTQTFLNISSTHGIDISFQKDDMYRRSRRLICFDMDSTLIKTECIDELAEHAGVGEQVRAITESAMRGEIDFNESFIQRIELLKGLDIRIMRQIAEKLPIMEGADIVMKILKKCGFKIAILSGGFTFFGKYLQERFGVDYVYANELEVDNNGILTGRHLGDIVDGKRKAELLKLIAQVEHLDLEQVIAVGDGANDLPMLNIAGLGIAFHAKPKVQQEAQQSINTIGLDGILYFLGFRDILFKELM